MWLIPVIAAFFIFFVIKVVDFYHKCDPSYKIAVKIGGPDPLTFCQTIKLGLSLNRINIFSSLRDFAQTYKKSYAFWFMGKMYLRIIRAEDMEKVVGSTKHTKKGVLYRFLIPLLGQGLLISEGTKWSQRRKILTPAFHFNILQKFLRVFQHEAANLAIHLETIPESPINVSKVISRHTLNVICETAMGITLDNQKKSQNYRECIRKAGKIITLRFIKPWLASETIFRLMGYEEKLREILTPIHSFTNEIIRERCSKFRDNMRTVSEKHAMLDTLLLAEQRKFIDFEGICEEVDTFTFEGHDTTASGITMILFLLAENPKVQERVYEEISEIVLEKNGILDMFDYTNMHYTERVIKESLRLYPPVPYITRELTEDQEINGCTVPKGTFIESHIYDLHRDPEYFPDPETFDPDRFLPENVERRHPFAYLPFSAGPRNCIGQKFALLEIKTVIESVLMNFILSPITHRNDLVFVADMVLRTKDPIWIQFTKR